MTSKILREYAELLNETEIADDVAYVARAKEDGATVGHSQKVFNEGEYLPSADHLHDGPFDELYKARMFPDPRSAERSLHGPNPGAWEIVKIYAYF